MTDPDAVELYRSVHKENVARFELTPPWRFIKRYKRYEACRSSFASLYANDSRNPTMPDRLWEGHWEAFSASWERGWGRPYYRGWSFALTATTGALAAVATICTLGYLAVNAIPWPSPDPPKPLPAGVVQKGHSFIIPANYASKATDGSETDPGELCDRLPGTSSVVDYDIIDNSDGSITIKCENEDD